MQPAKQSRNILQRVPHCGYDRRMATPSLKFANTFRIVARHGSFKLAAADLYITASAVSNQIRSLEAQLGVALFARGPHNLQLTEAGSYLFANIDSLFERFESVTSQLRTRFGKQLVRLAVPSLFATELLLPRLRALTASLSGIDLQMDTGTTRNSEHGADTDVSIIVGMGHWPQLAARRLFAQRFVAAAAPRLLHALGEGGVAQVGRFPLIVHARRPDLWDRWAAINGCRPLDAVQLVRLDSMSAVVSAAEQGVGFALVSRPLSGRRFAEGTLQRLADVELTTGEAYYLVARPQDTERAAVRALLDWLGEQFGLSDQEDGQN